MEYRELGKTGMNVSSVGFGASSLGGVFHALSEASGMEAVYTALELGINFIDVSPYYGHLKAETLLGKALANVDRKSFYLSTKVGRYGANGINTWDYSAARAQASVGESLERLHTDYLDLINVHDIEFADLEQVCLETLPALVELREQGIVRHIGLTNLNLRHFHYVIEHVPPGVVETILSFCHHTLNDDALLDHLDYFESRHIGVINASPYSMGLLTQRGAPPWHPAPEALKRLAAKAVEHCRAKGASIEALAMAFSAGNRRIATTLFSTTNPDNVRNTVRYASTPPDEDLLREVLHIFEPARRDTWNNS
jgi:aryl-alcohol dehydrogenase-like predicted oxidoreductase